MGNGISTEALLKLLAGEVSEEAFAAEQSMSVEQVRALRQGALGRIEGRRRWRGFAFAALFVLLPGAAVAQLVTFQADQPAQASQVNGNFAQLRAWIEMKTGTVADAGIQASTVSASTISATAVNATSVNASASVSATTLNVTTNATVSGVLTATVVNATTLNATTNANLSNAVVNGVNFRVKGSNNGTLSCDSFCLGAFDGFSGACVGIRLPSGQFSADCGFVPGLLPSGGSLSCLCATW
jgi:hypothetical protein